jgi:hypothetical protein
MKLDSKWLAIGVFGTVMGFWLRWFTRRRRPRPIDVGRVSDAWLSEQRGRNTEPW